MYYQLSNIIDLSSNLDFYNKIHVAVDLPHNDTHAHLVTTLSESVNMHYQILLIL